MTSYIAALDLAQNSSPRRDHWRATAAAAGLEIKQFVGKPTGENIETFIRNAAGLWIYDTTFIGTEGIPEIVHGAIAHGTRCLVEVDINECSAFNVFLERYGIASTLMGLHSVLPGETHPRLVEVTRATRSQCFRHPALFDDVDRVVLQQAHILTTTTGARSLLAVPTSDVEVTDLQRDLLHDVSAPEVAVIAMDNATERVLVTAAGLFHDPYHGLMGHEFPGISANIKLASNVVRWLGGTRAPASLEDAVSAFSEIDRIERAVARYLRRKLATVFKDWWTEGVPEAIRVGCATRMERDRNQFERHCYLDLLDWKEIAAANWEHIEAEWRMAGWSGNKNAGLRWFNEFNSIRNVVMHPTKRAFGPGALTPEHLAFLRRLGEQVGQLEPPNGYLAERQIVAGNASGESKRCPAQPPSRPPSRDTRRRSE